MSETDDEYYERIYVRTASPDGLCVSDAILLVAQYARHKDTPSMRMTPAQRRAWLRESVAVLTQLVDAGTRYSLDVVFAQALLAEHERGLGGLADRQAWASRAAAALSTLSSELHRKLSAHELDVATAWNILMRQGRRPVTFKTHAT